MNEIVKEFDDMIKEVSTKYNKNNIDYYRFEFNDYMKDNSLTWNVINVRNGHNVYNVFDNYLFYNDLVKENKSIKKYRKKMLKENTVIDENKLKDEFLSYLRRIINYYFNSRCEYESTITTFEPFIDKLEVQRIKTDTEEIKYRKIIVLDESYKIDVYGQLTMNFKQFGDYIWNNLDKFKKEIK